jgi:hypothetical protein
LKATAAAALFLAFPALLAFQAPMDFEAVASFLSRANPAPDGRWAYGWKATLQGEFRPYPTREEVVFQGIQFIGWSRKGGLPEAESCPYVAHNMSGKAAKVHRVFRLPPDMLSLHPGRNGEFTVVRWTAPWTGEYSIEARFEALDFATTDVYILHNASVIGEEIIDNEGASHDFSLCRMAVRAGDHIDFAVGYGQNRNYYGDSTGLRARIRLEPPR